MRFAARAGVMGVLLSFMWRVLYGGAAMNWTVRSDAFAPQGPIPSKYTCDGADVSPAFTWDEPPEGAQSLAFIADDPDAPVGTWVHWVVYNMPASSRELPENVPKQDQLPDGAIQGMTDFGRVGYGGPCPPSGTHRYYFTLYALDAMLTLPAKASKPQLLKAMEGHILAQAELMGTYRRP